jgi:hypothetical protein
MGRAKPKSKAKPKAASPVVLPLAATRKRAQVPDEHENYKCKALKGASDEEHRHGPEPNVLKCAFEEEDKPDEVVDGELVKEDDGAAEVVKEADGVAVTEDSEYRHPIGILAVTYTLEFTNNNCISTFYFCGTQLFVERVYLWKILFCGTNSSCFCGKLFLWNVFFVEWCYKETTPTQEVVNNDKGDEEKVDEVSKLALVEVQVVNDMEDVEEEPLKVPPQQAKHQ